MFWFDVYGEYAKALTPRPVGPMLASFIDFGSNLPAATRFAVSRSELTTFGLNKYVLPTVNAWPRASSAVPMLSGLWFKSNEAGVTLLSTRYLTKIEFLSLFW